ncbi:hypothetical protein [Hymenobacter algoricola]|uniref:Uncharacterized protein n=1 Tax=Hymenobacter algoricola TaxID=486267 RepID=A0ABP7M9S3_9BACT
MTDTPENQNPPAAGSTPDANAEQQGRQADAPTTPPTTSPAAGTHPASTQSNLGSGDGIRGSYGDASQTNGLEGGPDSAADGSPKEE